MFPRLLSVTAAVLLSAAVVSAEQARQRWPDSSGRASSGSGGQTNGGGSRNDGGGSRNDGGGREAGRSDGGGAAPRTAAPRGERVRETAPRQSPPPARASVPAREASPPQRTAVPRREVVAPPRAVAAEPAPRTEPASPQGAAVREGSSAAGQRTAQPRQRWPENASSGGVATGVAVPRGSVPQRDDRWDGRWEDRDDRRRGRTTVYVPRSRVYNNYYYVYPRRYHPYGYGSFGLGYFYYDPYTWYPYDRYDYRFSGYGYGYPTGEIRLQVRPRQAEVYVDGFYAGRVDEFDGFIQALRLEEGPYTIELVAPGYEPLVFDVRIQPGRKITYRGDMRPLRP